MMTADVAAEFDRLVASYYRTWFRFHPEAAVDVGVMAFAGQLTPYDDDQIGALTALQEKLLAGLEEIDAAALDDDRRIDFELLRGAALIEHHELLEQDWRRRDPLRFLPVHAVYQLTVRPIPDLAAALTSRLAGIPSHLRGARAHLAEMPELVPPVWLEAALAEARAGAEYLRGIADVPQVGRMFPNPVRVTKLAEDAARSLEAFALFLEQVVAPHAAGEFACGRAHFERLLEHRHRLPVDVYDLHAFGRRLFDTTAAQLRSFTRGVRGDEDVAALAERIKSAHPAARELLAAYQDGMRSARAFLAARDIVSLPPAEELRVVETPAFMRHRIPFAAYLEPAPGDPDQRGHYYVTPVDEEEQLREHNHAALAQTCVHEAWPGHHLQFVTANGIPAARTFPRLLNASATLYEGWALYCEQLMHEQGYLDRPEHRFMLLRDRLWRALRVMLDVELHTRGLAVDGAARRMQESLGFPYAQAHADVSWYTGAPGVPMGYAVGWALINAARDLLVSPSHGVDLQHFHDRLLASGSVALPLAIRRAFGAPAWERARDAVFSPAGGAPS